MNRLPLSLLVLLASLVSFGCGDDVECLPPGVSIGGRCIVPDGAGPDSGDASRDASPDVPPMMDAGMPSISFVDPPELIRARAGVATPVSIEIERTDFDGPVTVTLSGLPTGAAASPVEIPAGSSVAELQVMAAGTAIGGPYAVVLTVTATDVASIEAPARLYVAGSPGQRDTTFGTSGTATYAPGVEVVLGGIDLDSDIGLVAAGGDDADGISYVVRFTQDGSRDTEFGTAGAIVGLGVGQTRAFDVVSTPGALRVLGAADPFDSYTRPLIRAYDSTGALETDFGTDGDVALTVGPRFVQLASRGDGLVARSRDEIIALNASGAVVSSFTPALGGQHPSAVVADSSGSVTFGVEDDDAFLIRRVGPAGAADPTFGVSGVTRVSPPVLDSTDTRVVLSDLLPDGSLYVGGVNENTTSNKISGSLFRLTADGDFDVTFSESIVVFSDLGGLVEVVALADRGALVLGWDRVGTNDNPVMRRYLDDGSLDASFADGGSLSLPLWATSTFDSVDFAGTMVVDEASGRVYVCGTTEDGMAIACRRYWL